MLNIGDDIGKLVSAVSSETKRLMKRDWNTAVEFQNTELLEKCRIYQKDLSAVLLMLRKLCELVTSATEVESKHPYLVETPVQDVVIDQPFDVRYRASDDWTVNDWVGVYTPGDLIENYVAFAAVPAAGSGTISLTIPAGTPTGKYVIRYYSFATGSSVKKWETVRFNVVGA